MGPLRFTLYGLWRSLINLRKYSSTLFYLNEDCELDNSLSLKDDLENKTNWTKVNGPFTYFVANNIPHLSEDVYSHPLSKSDDSHIDIIAMSEETNGSKTKLVKLLLNQDNGDYFHENSFNMKNNLGMIYKKTKAFKVQIPINTNKTGNYSIDGEKYKLESTFVKIIPSCLSVFSWKN